MVARALTEGELIALASDGDGDAYASLVRAHQDVAFRTAMLITQNAAEAEEAAQEAFVKAWRALPRFRPDAPFRPWLLAIVANEARNRRRAAGRRAGLALRAAQERVSGDAAPSPEAALLAGGERRELLAALGALDERDRAVIACRHLLDLSERETAEVLGCRSGTVKSRLSRALGRMRAELERAGAGEVVAP